MELRTLSDVRAALARKRVPQKALAERLGKTPESFSHLMGFEDDVQLTDAAATRWSAVIEDLSETRQGVPA